MGKIDKNLFIYLTKKAGYTLRDVGDLWGVGLQAVYRRLNMEVEIDRAEMDSWMRLVGVYNAGPVFFSDLAAKTIHDEAAGSVE